MATGDKSSSNRDGDAADHGVMTRRSDAKWKRTVIT
jgi:hypothetical protein